MGTGVEREEEQGQQKHWGAEVAHSLLHSSAPAPPRVRCGRGCSALLRCAGRFSVLAYVFSNWLPRRKIILSTS